MSDQLRARAFEEGRVKALHRMKQPLAPPPRQGYIRSHRAQRRADRVALQRLLQEESTS